MSTATVVITPVDIACEGFSPLWTWIAPELPTMVVGRIRALTCLAMTNELASWCSLFLECLAMPT